MKDLSKVIGDSIRNIRLQKNITQDSLAAMAGISLSAIRHLEDGKSNLSTLCKVLELLNKRSWAESLAPYISINPLDMVKGKPRRRAKIPRLSKELINKIRSNSSLKQYGLTVSSYVEMHTSQGGKCGNKGCQRTLELGSTDTHVDHCHKSGLVRGLLCRWCNAALGFVKDNPEAAIGLSEYLNNNLSHKTHYAKMLRKGS